MDKWGPFGQKKKFMDAHPGATDGDWEKADRAQYEKKRGGRKVNGDEEE